MAGHNPRERRLFEDLNQKNRLAAEFRRLSSRLQRWQERLAAKRGKRWQKRYTLSIRRASNRMTELQSELLTRAKDLQARIQEEQKVSVAEVKKFEQQYKKEVQELKDARKEFEEARKSFAKAEAAAAQSEGDDEVRQAAVVLTGLRRHRWNAAGEVRRETQDKKRAEREIASEQRDKEVLAYEMRRIVAEIESLSA